ncbi:MAG TPA: TetR family transcriptional regulator [Aliidongia sp.]|nr:TetR family transcriptional regulator [Aliidongia sp.]
MRLTKEQRAENHEKIVKVAAKLFREKGVDGVGIDEIMAAAGLTHGAFYGHFPSKTALTAEAGAQALAESRLAQRRAAQESQLPFVGFARFYLSDRHRDAPGGGCAVAGMGADIGRQDDEVQAVFSQGMEAAVDELAAQLPGPRDVARRDAIAKYASLIGALIMARSVGKTPLSHEILDTVRQKLEAEG